MLIKAVDLHITWIKNSKADHCNIAVEQLSNACLGNSATLSDHIAETGSHVDAGTSRAEMAKSYVSRMGLCVLRLEKTMK